MTKSFGVNENNDIFIAQDGNLSVVTGIVATLFACAQAAKAQLGEMIFAVDQGIPNFQTVWIGTPNIPQFEAYLRANILAVAGVQSIKNLSTNASNNVLNYKIVILTVYGQVVLVSENGNLSGVMLDENGQPLLLENGGFILLE